MGAIKCVLDLAFDILRQIIAIFVPHPSGVGDFDESLINLNRHGQSIARDAGRRVDDHAIRRPTSQLNIEDLPTFGRPTMGDLR